MSKIRSKSITSKIERKEEVPCYAQEKPKERRIFKEKEV
jgi:hypothetical protein